MIDLPRAAGMAILALLLLTLPAGSSLAAARTLHPGRHAPIRGMIVGIGSGSAQIQTMSGSISLSLAATTRVIRVLSGSIADLTPGAQVRLRLVPGTRTVAGVRIDLPAQHPRAKGTQLPAPHPGVKRPDDPLPSQPPHPTGDERPRATVEGRLIGIAGNSLTIRARQGQRTYLLGDAVMITKLMVGNLSDLAIGEAVQVLSFGNRAVTITIFQA